MKVLVVIAAILAMSTARPQSPKDAVVETQSFDNIGTGPFNWASNDGVDRQESGLLKNVNSANPSLSVSGTYTYVVDGKTISVSYVADENGFQPKGAHIPGERRAMLTESEEDRSEKGGDGAGTLPAIHRTRDINDSSSGGSGNLACRTTFNCFSWNWDCVLDSGQCS
uniref:Uncharacterized protein n=1 Tax=Timema bartmani TaxID=61472 RepID=A0A7R9EVZ9_9NEOP|nr:unnamed protein product [Timema bartmani]